MILDLFSGGAGGWCFGARALGLDPIGIECDGNACRTRAAAGLRTIRADIATYPPEVFAGKVEGLCGSPPCQAFSAAGKQKGLADPRGQLVHEPMRWARIVRPRWWDTPSRVVCGQRTPRWAYEGNPTTGRTLNRDGQMRGLPAMDPTTSPAPTVTGEVGKSHQWCWERPATTIPATYANAKGGAGMVAPPGHHTTGTYTEGKGAVRVAIAELGVLQGFPADHPWQAPEAAKQVGNAIPPPLAEACLRAVAGEGRIALEAAS